jgi:hypothetical protein
MGCDIHVVLEYQLDDGQWMGINSYSAFPTVALDRTTHVSSRETMFWKVTNRNYAFFASLAGVRGDGPEPLGMPEDASPMARLRLGYSDLHSHSYMSAMTFVNKWRGIDDRVAAVKRALRGEEMDVEEAAGLLGPLPFMFDREERPDDAHPLDAYRVVFAFDN